MWYSVTRQWCMIIWYNSTWSDYTIYRHLAPGRWLCVELAEPHRSFDKAAGSFQFVKILLDWWWLCVTALNLNWFGIPYRPQQCSFRKTTENRAHLIFASDVGYFPIEQRHVCLYIMLMYWNWMQCIGWDKNWDWYIFCSRCNVWNLILWIQLI